MKEIRKRIRKRLFLLYAVFGYCLISPATVLADTLKTQNDVVVSSETLIRSLLDPFIARVKELPEPKIEAPVPVVVPKVEPILVVPEPVIEVPVEPAVILKPNMDLTGIMYDVKRPMAIIDGLIVEQDDRINLVNGEATVTKIEKRSVRITHEGKEFTFSLDNDQEK